MPDENTCTPKHFAKSSFAVFTPGSELGRTTSALSFKTHFNLKCKKGKCRKLKCWFCILRQSWDQWKASVKVFTRQQARLVSRGFSCFLPIELKTPRSVEIADLCVSRSRIRTGFRRERGVCTTVLAQCFTVTQTEPEQSAGQRCYQNWPRNLTQAHRTLCTLFTCSSFPFPPSFSLFSFILV